MQCTHEKDLDELEDQWGEILYAKATLITMSTSPTAEFWDELRAVRDGNDARKFELLIHVCDVVPGENDEIAI